MKHIPQILFAAACSALVMTAPAFAQTPVIPVPVTTTPPARPAQAATDSLVPLRVQVNLVRYQGEKKVSSLPFTLVVIAGERESTSFNNGQSVPTPGPNGQVNYQNIGTNIVASAERGEDGRYRVMLSVNDSSVAPAREPRGPGTVDMAMAPTIKSLRFSNRLLLRDGQTLEFLASTDPITGEVTRIEVTATALK